MDKAAAIKLLGGTIARGVLWASGFVVAKMGIEELDKDTAAGVGMFAASILVWVASAIWSSKKNKKLADAEPK